MKVRPFFLTELHHTPFDEEGYATLTAPLVFYSEKAKLTIEARAGFRTNFVTGKKLLVVRRIVHDRMNGASVIHDELYGSGVVSRALADAIFLEAMIVSKVARWRAYLAYAAVRACGWQFYGSTDTHEESMAP